MGLNPPNLWAVILEFSQTDTKTDVCKKEPLASA